MYWKLFWKADGMGHMGNRFGKLVRYDLHYGYQDCRLKWLCALLVQIYFANAAYQGCSMAEGTVGVVGYLTWLFSGKTEYFVVETGRFELPVPWLMLHGCLLFLVGFYPANDLMRSGGQAFVRSGRRRNWLLGKAVWVVGTVAAYYVGLTVVLMSGVLLAEGGTLLAGEQVLLDEGGVLQAGEQMMQTEGGIVLAGESTLQAGESTLPAEGQALIEEWFIGSPEALEFLFSIPIAEMGRAEIFLSWWLEPFLVSVALCLTEMVLSLLLEPAVALFVMLGYLTASVFWTTPGLLGNYAMLLRQDFWSGNGAVSFTNCMIGSVMCSVLALLAGIRYVRNKDVFIA